MCAEKKSKHASKAYAIDTGCVSQAILSGRWRDRGDSSLILCSASTRNMYQSTHKFLMPSSTIRDYLDLNLWESLTVKDSTSIHADFSKNQACMCFNEIQSVHFGGSHQHVTLQTRELYLANLASQGMTHQLHGLIWTPSFSSWQRSTLMSKTFT